MNNIDVIIMHDQMTQKSPHRRKKFIYHIKIHNFSRLFFCNSSNFNSQTKTHHQNQRKQQKNLPPKKQPSSNPTDLEWNIPQHTHTYPNKEPLYISRGTESLFIYRGRRARESVPSLSCAAPRPALPFLYFSVTSDGNSAPLGALRRTRWFIACIYIL